MGSMNDVVKQIVERQLEARQLAAAIYGTVSNINPLEVTVDQRFTVPADFLVVPEHLTDYSVTVGGQTIQLRRGLAVNDKLILLRSDKGQDYVILGRLTT